MSRQVNGVFVTGTDTDCGKTVIAGGIGSHCTGRSTIADRGMPAQVLGANAQR